MTPTQDLELQRGDTWTGTLDGLGDLAGVSEIWLTAKRDKDDLDSAAIFQIILSGGLVILNGAPAATPTNGWLAVVPPAGDGIIAYALAAVETATFDSAPSPLYYDAQKMVGGVVTTPRRAKLFLSRDVTRATADGSGSFAPCSVFRVIVTANWAVAANALADIEAASGMDFPAALDVFVALWEGVVDPDDFAELHAGGVGAPEWVAHNGLASPFASFPALGAAVCATAVYPQP